MGVVVAHAVGAVGGTLKVGLSRSKAEHDPFGVLARLVDDLVAELAPTADRPTSGTNDSFAR